MTETESSSAPLPRRLSKTLHNGIRILELLTERPTGSTIAEIAEDIGAEWSVAQRLVLTLQHHNLVRRDDHKRIHLGPGLISLSDPIDRNLRTAAGPILQRLADKLHATSNLVIAESDSQVRALMVVEPSVAPVHIAFKPGQAHDIDQGASGLAILSTRPTVRGEREEVTQARKNGYAITFGEVIPHVTGIAAPVRLGDGPSTMAIGVSVLLEVDNLEEITSALFEASAELGAVYYLAEAATAT